MSSMVSLVRVDRKVATREAIMNSALELFADRGYDAVRVEDVARAAGVSRATFYNHFSERDEVLGALFERLLAVNLLATDGEGPDTSGDEVPPLEKIGQVATGAARRMLRRQRLARLLYSLPIRHESLLKPDAPTTPAVFRTIHRLLEAAAARGELRTDVPLDLMCIHVHNALEAGMRGWAEGRTDDAVGRVKTLVELAVHGVVARDHR